MLGTQAVAEQLGVRRQAVLYWITNGVTVNGTRHQLPATRAGKNFKVQPSALDEFLRALNEQTTTSEAVSAAALAPSERRADSARLKGRSALERALQRK